MTACTVASVRVVATRLALLLVLVLSLLASAPLFAQILSPRTVEFDPSPDHDRTVNGVNIVERYSLTFYVLGGTVALQVVDLGKPAAQTDGKIRVDFTSLLGLWPLDGLVYEARVTAIGPGGSTASGVSNTFSFPGTGPAPPPECDPSLSISNRSTGAASTTGTVGVTVASGCGWNATSDASWLTVTSGASGTGNGSVGYGVSANTAPSLRVAHLTIGDQTFTLTQAGLSCTYDITTTSRSGGSSATTGTIGVTTTTGCTWSAGSDANWLTISSGGTGNGNGTVAYSVAANSSSTLRVGHLTIAGQIFTFSQTGVTCTFTLSTTSRSNGSGSTTGTVGVTAPGGCAWTAASDAGWLSITNSGAGTGNGSVSYSVSTNNSTSQRVGRLTIAGSTFTFTQAGATCSYTLSSTNRTVGATATTGSVSVTAANGCTWSAASSSGWLTITSGASGSGNGTVNYRVDANTSASVREATLTIGGEEFTLGQNGTCTYTLTPATQSFVPSGGNGTVTVSAGTDCSWTATRSGSWITITSGSSGRGNGTVRYRVSANGGSQARTGTLTIAGQAVPVTQPAATAPNKPAGLRIVTIR